MARDMSDTVRDALTHAVREVIKTTEKPVKKGGALSGGAGSPRAPGSRPRRRWPRRASTRCAPTAGRRRPPRPS